MIEIFDDFWETVAEILVAKGLLSAFLLALIISSIVFGCSYGIIKFLLAIGG